VLGPRAEPDHARRDAPQQRPASQQAHGERRLDRRFILQHPHEHVLLHGDLESLRNSRGKFAPALHCAERLAVELPLVEDVGRRDGVLDGEVDAHAADRRHGVRGVADA